MMLSQYRDRAVLLAVALFVVVFLLSSVAVSIVQSRGITHEPGPAVAALHRVGYRHVQLTEATADQRCPLHATNHVGFHAWSAKDSSWIDGVVCTSTWLGHDTVVSGRILRLSQNQVP
jgi:hypothetical protein